MAHRTPMKPAVLLVPVLALLASCSSSGTNPPAPAAAPAISSISPTLGPATGGTPITIEGAHFVAGAQVTFGTAAASVTSVSAGTITVTTPARAAGTVDVRVSNPDGQQATLAGGFTYQTAAPPAPSISSFSPAVGPTAGGTTVTILGANFAAGVQVVFDNSPATFVSLTGDSVIAATTPPHGAGPVDVTVRNADGRQVVLAAAFTYEAPPPPPDPAITSVSPSSGALGGGTTVTIAGANFAAGPTLAVRFGGLAASSVTAVLPGAITAVTPPGAALGAVDVQVVNPNGRSATLAAGFTYLTNPPPPGPAPVLTSIAPTAGSTAGGTTVVLTGRNFVAGAGLVVLVGLNSAAVTPGSVTATSITVTTPPAQAAGPADVTVVNPDGQRVTQPGEFTYQAPPPPAPAITSLNPTSGPTGGGTVVTISGQNFATGATVLFDATSATPTSVTGSSITVTTPARGPGAANVTVRNPDGQTSAPATFTYVGPAGPTITSLSRTSGATTGGELCDISGSGFVTGSVVTFGGATASLVPGSTITSTLIRVAVPARPAGAGVVDVTVTNPGGGTFTLPSSYTYLGPAPVVLTLNVRGGPTAGGTQVVAVGSGFVAPARVTVGGKDATNVSLVNVGVGSTGVSFFTPSQPEGLYDVVVFNPDGQFARAPFQFHYGPAPVVTALSCSGGCDTVRRGDVITLSGDHFSVGAGQGVQVIFASADTGQQAFATAEAVPTPTTTQFSVLAPKLDGGLCANPPRPCRYSLVVNNFDGQTGVAPTQVTYQ